MIGYCFEIYDRDGRAEHTEAGPIALSRDGPDGWVAGGTIAEGRVIGGRRGRTPREAVLKSLLAPGPDPTPAELAADVFDTVVTQDRVLRARRPDRPRPGLPARRGAEGDPLRLAGGPAAGPAAARGVSRPRSTRSGGTSTSSRRRATTRSRRRREMRPEGGRADPGLRAQETRPWPAAECTGDERRRRLTAADARAYVAGGGIRCPYCRDDDISGGPVEVEAGGAWQEVTCSGCGAAWRDVYTLAGLDLLDGRGRYLDTLDGTVPIPIEEVLDDGATPGEPTRPVELYVGLAPGAGDVGSWHTTTVRVPRRVPRGRLGEAAIHLLRRRLEAEGTAVAFVGVHHIPATEDDGDEVEAG